jgi:hypothetical protein
VDTCAAIAGADPIRVQAEGVSGARGVLRNDDQVVITLKLADGSVATIVYASGGDPSVAKERIEVMCDGASATLEDFRALEVVRGGKSSRSSRLFRDKGHRKALDAFLAAARGEALAIPLRSLVATTLATFGAVESLQTGIAVDLEGDVAALVGAPGKHD